MFADVATILIASEYLGAQLQWNSGTLGHAALAGEIALAVSASGFGTVGTIFGLLGIDGVGGLTELASGFGVFMGMLGAFFGFVDMYGIYYEWPHA
jgi:hypothetical protein